MTVGRVPVSLVPPGGTELLHEWCKPVGLAQQMSIPCGFKDGGHRAFVLAQNGEDFCDEALELGVRECVSKDQLQELPDIVRKYCPAA